MTHSVVVKVLQALNNLLEKRLCVLFGKTDLLRRNIIQNLFSFYVLHHEVAMVFKVVFKHFDHLHYVHVIQFLKHVELFEMCR